MKTTGIHTALCYSTEKYARVIMEELFGLEEIKSFTASTELVKNLFGVEKAVKMIVYNAGPFDIEVFISEPPKEFTFAHICLSVENRDEMINRAKNLGLHVNSHQRPDGPEIVFFKDGDGNLYEIKES